MTDQQPLYADIRDAFFSELDAGQQSALIGWLAFTGTFSGVRGITHAIRAARGPFRNLSVGGSRLHVDVGIGGSSLTASYFAALPVTRKVHGTHRERRRQARGE